MEEDPLIPLVHVWNNAAFDHVSSSAWHPSPARAMSSGGASREAAAAEGDKENHRPDLDAEEPDVEAEIGHIEAEILRLSSRLHHLRTSSSSSSKQLLEPSKRGEVVAPAVNEVNEAKVKAVVRPRTTRGLSLGPLDVAAVVKPNAFVTDKQQQLPPRVAQGLKPIKQAPSAARGGRGVSLGPLDIVAATNPRVPSGSVAANPRVPSAAATTTAVAPQTRPILRPIKEPPVQRRRGVSLGPMEIHNGVGGKPGAAAAARVKPFVNKLGAVREEVQRSKQQAVPARPWPSSSARQGTAASKSKARSGSMSPSRFRRQSTSKATETRAGNAKAAAEAARGGNAAGVVNKVADELKPKVVGNHTSNAAATAKRPAGSSKVRVVPSRYSITPGSSVAASTQEKRCKQSLQGPASAASQKEEIKAKLTEPSNDDEQSPGTVAKVAELLPKIKTMPPSDESPRDSGCAKRVADLVGKRSFFAAAAADDGNLVTPYQARVVELESPEAAADEEEA